MAETSVSATDRAALVVALQNQPQLAARPDGLGNLQTIFAVKATGAALSVLHPDDVPASVIQTANGQVPAVIAARAAAATVAATAGTNETTIRDRLLTGLATVDTHITNIDGASTPAQQKAALLFALRAVKQLARLAVHEVSSAD